jgi:hypothetical protein
MPVCEALVSDRCLRPLALVRLPRWPLLFFAEDIRLLRFVIGFKHALREHATPTLPTRVRACARFVHFVHRSSTFLRRGTRRTRITLTIMPLHESPDASADLRTTALTLLRHTVTLPWESVDQIIAHHAESPLGDPTIPGTAAWHLRHIAEIFQLHAATVRGEQPPDPARLPTSPRALRDQLLADINAFDTWLAQQPATFFTAPINYGGPHTFLEMISIMLQHITWHAAAVHYWFKFSTRWQIEPR